jgi:hypothetical protein
LLRHFGSSLYNDSIIGDLNERYRDGRSRLWYWRQVSVAVLVQWFHEIHEHKIPTFIVVGISWIHVVALGRVFGYLASGAANPLTAYVFANLLPYRWWEHNLVFWPVDWLLTWLPLFLVSIFTGWLISLFPRRYGRPLVLTSLMFTTVVVAPATWRMLLGLPTVPLYFSVRGIFIPFQTLLGIALGGGLLSRPKFALLTTP